MPARNNVTRLLDSRKVEYEIFELSAEKHTAEDTAAMLGVPAEVVFKTIVVTREKPGKPILCMVPANSEVDLKRLAVSLGEKKLALPTQHEAESLTGLQAGGISALALLNKGFQICLDASAQALSVIYISGGQRGLSISLSVTDLLKLTNARVVNAVVKHPLGAAA